MDATFSLKIQNLMTTLTTLSKFKSYYFDEYYIWYQSFLNVTVFPFRSYKKLHSLEFCKFTLLPQFSEPMLYKFELKVIYSINNLRNATNSNDSDYFDPSIHEPELMNNNSGSLLKSDKNDLLSLPKIESFIIPKEENLGLFESQGTKSADSPWKVVKSAIDKPKRLKRWLKDQDRKMIKIILDLSRTNDIDRRSLTSNISHNDEAMIAWWMIKNRMDTDRSIDFLQERYQKLISNQKLNSKELSLLHDTVVSSSKRENCSISIEHHLCDIPSLEELMIKFPGKTADTLNLLIEKIKANNEKNLIKENKLDWMVDEKEINHEFTLGK